MFRYLKADGLSSNSQRAKVFFYGGADSALMMQKLMYDSDFTSINQLNVQRVFILTGSNNVDKIYEGSCKLDDAKRDIAKLLKFLTEHFTVATVNVINILPRVVKGRNDVIEALNNYIEHTCSVNCQLNYVDTETEIKLFTTAEARRVPVYFAFNDRRNKFDNVHLSQSGVSRLARHLMYLSHIPNQTESEFDYLDY